MTRASLLLGVILGLFALTSATKCPKQKQSPGREVLCYTSTNDLEQLTDTVCRCTTLVHQGYDVRNITSSDVKTLRKILKDVYPALQIVVSVIDPTGILKTSATLRQDASSRLANVLKEVDGVELNITAGSKERLFHFVKNLKDEMVRKSADKRIFVALPSRSADIAKQFDLKELSKYVDLFTVSTDYLVDDDEVYHTFHPSRLIGLFDMLNTDSLVDLIIGLGAPKRKILVSLPASGFKFMLANEEENAPRSPTKEKEPAVINRKELCDSVSDGEWTIERDEDLTAPYAFKNKTWIAFEDSISTGIKGKYVMVRDLAGLGIKDLENDLQTDCGKPLAHEVHHSFTNFKRKSRQAVLSSLEDDLHQSKISYANHIKSSDFRIVRVVDTEGHIRAVRESTQVEFSCPRQGYFVHPKSCNRFYRCVKFNQGVENYSVFEFDCPAGLSFDEQTEVCVWPHTLPQGSPCPGSSEIASVGRTRFECPDKPGYYADPQNGRWFFACFDLGQPHLMAFEFRCPYGLVFDENKLICEWPWNVPGYEASEYTRTEYGTGGYTAASVGYSSTGGIGVSYTGGGHSGPAGVAYESGKHGGVTVSRGHSGTTGSGYSGAVSGSHVGTTDITGSGYSRGAGGTQIGITGSEYTDRSHLNTVGSGYTGSVSGAHIGIIGSGYSGGADGAHTSTAASGYSGGADGAQIGITRSGYSGDAGGVSGSHVSATESTYSGGTGGTRISTTGSEYLGGANGASIGITESGYSGGTSGSRVSATGSVHSGSLDGAHISSIGLGYSDGVGGSHAGTTVSGLSGGTSVSHDSAIGSGYFGASTDAHSGTAIPGFGGYSTGTGQSGYSGGIGGAYVSTTQSGYSDGAGGVHIGSTGSRYSESAGGGQFSTTGLGYTDGAGGVHLSTIGTDYSGSVGGAHVETTGSGYSSSSGSVYTSGGHAGTTGSKYVESFGNVQTSDSSSGTTGYAGSSSIAYGGSVSGNRVSSAGSAYAGSSSVGGSLGTKYTGSTAGIYTGGTSGGSSGSGGLSTGGYTGSREGYTGQTVSTGIGVSKTGYSIVTPHTGNTGGSVTTSRTEPSDGSSHTISIGSEQPSIPIYASSHPTGTGYPATGSSSGSSYLSVTSSGKAGTTGYGRVPTLNEQRGVAVSDQSPIIQYVPSTPGVGLATSKTTLSSGSLGTSGYAIDHGQSGGTTYTSGRSPVIGGHESNIRYTGGATSGTSYHGVGFTQVYGSDKTGQDGLNTTLAGRIPSGPIYHGDYGSTGIGGIGTTGGILTGSSLQGSIITEDSTSGTVITAGNTGGSILTGSTDQGAIITGASYPGYVKTEAGTPGYVVDGGTKTIYTGSASPGTSVYGSVTPEIILHGGSVPGVTLTGGTSPDFVLTGQTAPGLSLGGSVYPGTIVGGSTGGQFYPGSTSTSYHGTSGAVDIGSTNYIGITKVGRVPITPAQSTGYQTNEYHDNGGRGTIRFNNGDVTTKYTEKDLPDYRPSIGVVPETVTPGGRIEGIATLTGGQHQTERTNIRGGTSFTPSGFTKTGPTKTGYTTASLGGSGSYVISTGSKPTLNPENIGEKAFSGNVGQTDSSRTTSTFTSTKAPIVSSVDTAKITLGPSASNGYTYPKPKIQFGAGVSPTPAEPVSPGSGRIFDGTTSKPILNVEVYNKPTPVASVTVTPSVNTFAFGKTEDTNYKGSTFSRVPTGFSKVHSSTVSPGLYTTGPLENFKTTVFEAAKIPVTISTVQPVIDDGYKTIISQSTIPVTLSGSSFTYKDGSYQTGSVDQRQTTSDVGTIFRGSGVDQDHIPVTTYRPIISSGSRKPYGSSVSVATYQQPTVTVKPEIQYLPTSTASPIGSTVSPVVGVTYRKPFSVPGITYQSTSRPTIVTFSSDNTGQGYSTQSQTTFGLGTGFEGSPTKVDIPRDKVEKLVTNYKGTSRGTVKYSPSIYDTYTGSDLTETTGAFDGFSSKKTLSSSFGTSSFGQFGTTATAFGKTKGPAESSPEQYDTTLTEFGRTQGSAGSSFGQFDTTASGFSKTQGSSGSFGQHGTTASSFGRTQSSSTAISEYGSTGSAVTEKLPAVTTYSGGYTRVSSVTPSYEVATKAGAGQGKGKIVVKWSDLHPLLLGKLGAQCTCKSDPFANIRGPARKLIESNKGQVDLANYDESDVYVDLENEGDDYDNNYGSRYGSTASPFRIITGELPTLPVIGKEFTGSSSTTYLPGISSTVSSIGDFNDNIAIPSGSRFGKNLIARYSPASLISEHGASFDRFGPGGLRDTDEILEGVSDCARPGLFRHPNFCNKFYACHWDEWKKKFTLHVFNCPVHLTFDTGAGACNWPSKGPACQDDNLLV